MIPVREGKQVHQDQGILHYLNDVVITESDKKEIIAHHQSEEDKASGKLKVDLLDDIVFKANFIKSFEELMPRLQMSGKETVLEMGGGWCWASVLVKRKYPHSYIVGSDLISTNLKYTVNYEKILNAHLDEKWVFNCRDLPFESNQFDRIFTFAAFHHFGEKGDYSKTLKEMVRVLKPKGKIVLLYEPSSPKYLYKWAFKRANTNAYADEDVLVISRIKQHVTPLNCQFSAELFPFFLYREGITQTVYYYILSKLSPLKNLVPCTVNITIEKD
jgi:ubiquinone/menaquinone biosynthesis C-methylase UbiE